MNKNLSAEAGSIEQFRADFAPVLRSYNAMETTKRRHFDYLSMLENKKKKFNLAATATEESTLQDLLRDHNDEVQEFKSLSQQLKSSSPLAHEALFQYIGQLNSALAPVNTSTGH